MLLISMQYRVMKNVVVFDVENVMFNVKNVEKWLKGSEERLEKMNDVEREKEFESKEEFKWWNEFERAEEFKRRERYLKGSLRKCRMCEGMKENMERLMGLRKVLDGRLKVFVVSGFGSELVWRLLGDNGIVVDGVYGSIGKIMGDYGYESKDVVYFSGSERRWCEGDVMKVNNVFCGWGNGFAEGLMSVDGIWKEIGVKVNFAGERGDVDSSEKSGEMVVENAGDISDIKLNKDNIGEYGDIDVVGVIYRSSAGMSSDPGSVWMMDSEGRDLGFNMSEDGIKMEDAEEAIPSLKLQGPFAVWQYLGMGDCLTVDLYKWREYEKKNHLVRENSCYTGWMSTVEELFRLAAEGKVFDAA